MIVYDGVIFSLQHQGGISVLYRSLFDGLQKANRNFNVLTYGSVGLGDYNETSIAARFLERYRDVSELCVAENSIFHSTYYRLPEGRSASAIVTTVHDYTYEYFSSGIRKGIHSWQKNRAVLQSDLIICVSESTKLDMLRFTPGKVKGEIVVVPNGVSDDYQWLCKEIKEQVLFVGARSGYKNFSAAVMAVSELPELVMVCVGGGAFTKSEERLLERYLFGRYKHCGYVDNETLNNLYNQSICLIYPSLYEGFGIPVLEAMRAGCPVIAVRSSSIPEVAGDAAYLIARGEPQEIVRGIRWLMLDKNRTGKVLAGLEQANKFSWDNTVSQTLKAYDSL